MKNLFLIASVTLFSLNVIAQSSKIELTANGLKNGVEINNSINHQKIEGWVNAEPSLKSIDSKPGLYSKIAINEAWVNYTEGGVQDSLLFNGTVYLINGGEKTYLDFGIVSAEVDGYAFTLTGGGMGGSFFSNSGRVRTRARIYRQAIEAYLSELVDQIKTLD